MTKREKNLAWISGGVAAVFVAGVMLDRLIIAPLKRADARTLELKTQLSEIEQLEVRSNVALHRLKRAAARAYSGTSDETSSRVGGQITSRLLAAGLDEGRFTRLPLGGRNLLGAREIGWSVQGVGPLERVIDFLYLLEAAPHLHRIENLVVAPKESGGLVTVHFRYLSLIFERPPEGEGPELETEPRLDVDERRPFDAIATRDLFRPYIKRPSPAPAPAPEIARDPGPETFKVVSLSRWKGECEVVVLDLTRNKTQTYRPGDALAGGTVAAIDYRARPSRKNPEIESHSRVIIVNGQEYWAVESGDTLADRYRLGSDQLPPDLRTAR